MSNDVYFAKLNKIQRTQDITKTEPTARRYKKLSQEPISTYQLHDSTRQIDEADMFVVNTSPRSGLPKQNYTDLDSPDITQRDTTESDNNISSCSTLDIVNKVENLALQKLENQIRDLNERLREAEENNLDVQRQLKESNAEKEVCFRRLEVVSSAHECRITEMHCVIAELNKKLRAKQENTIIEEQEPEGSEISYQEESVYNSELNLTNPDAECQTEPLVGGDFSLKDELDNIETNLCSELSEGLKLNDTINRGQVEALQEEVLHLKSQIALLQSEIANRSHLEAEAVMEEQQSIEFYGEDVEANESNYSLEQRLTKKNEDDVLESFKHCDPLISPQNDAPIPKMAERVKLRCANKSALDHDTTNVYVNTEMKDNESVSIALPDNSLMNSFIDTSQIDTELQRLQRQIEQLKVHNTMLSCTLDESKEHCEHLYLLCGKYESNAIALQMAVNCSDRAIEAYDVMLALLESNLVLMKDKTALAEESRRAVESVARHLLDRLESEKNVCENSLGPWQNNFSIPDKVRTMPWTSDDDNRLRYHVSKLKGIRATVQNTIVNLESPFSDFYEKSRMALEKRRECQEQEKPLKIDLDMAVLLQEMLDLREENITLKTKLNEMDKERQCATERINILQESLKQLQMQLNDDATSELFDRERLAENRFSYSETEYSALTEQQLVEALSRESELKGRIQTLISSITTSQKLSDEKYDQLKHKMRDLQKSNISLTQHLEQSKRKYQMRVRKLEQKIVDITMDFNRQNYNENAVQIQQQSQQRSKCKNISTKLHNNVPETTL